jgi:dolichyl-phosphate beta-glucosyltransferase
MLLAVHAIVVVPCYNEEKRLDREAFRSFAVEGHRVEFLFVNDGSHDGTLRLLEALHAECPDRLSLLNLERNSGKAEAVRQGFGAAFARNPDAVAFWDADLATPLSELPAFLEILATRPSIGMIFGARVRLLGLDISRRPARHYLGRVGATLISVSLGLAIYDTQCGAKLFRNTTTLREVFATPFLSRWLFDVEIIARHIRLRGRDVASKAIVEQPVRVWHDVAGSKIRSTDFVRALRDLWKIHRIYRT